jgi:hypothetical protein
MKFLFKPMVVIPTILAIFLFAAAFSMKDMPPPDPDKVAEREVFEVAAQAVPTPTFGGSEDVP